MATPLSAASNGEGAHHRKRHPPPHRQQHRRLLSVDNREEDEDPILEDASSLTSLSSDLVLSTPPPLPYFTTVDKVLQLSPFIGPRRTAGGVNSRNEGNKKVTASSSEAARRMNPNRKNKHESPMLRLYKQLVHGEHQQQPQQHIHQRDSSISRDVTVLPSVVGGGSNPDKDNNDEHSRRRGGRREEGGGVDDPDIELGGAKEEKKKCTSSSGGDDHGNHHRRPPPPPPPAGTSVAASPSSSYVSSSSSTTTISSPTEEEYTDGDDEDGGVGDASGEEEEVGRRQDDEVDVSGTASLPQQKRKERPPLHEPKTVRKKPTGAEYLQQPVTRYEKFERILESRRSRRRNLLLLGNTTANSNQKMSVRDRHRLYLNGLTPQQREEMRMSLLARDFTTAKHKQSMQGLHMAGTFSQAPRMGLISQYTTCSPGPAAYALPPTLMGSRNLSSEGSHYNVEGKSSATSASSFQEDQTLRKLTLEAMSTSSEEEEEDEVVVEGYQQTRRSGDDNLPKEDTTTMSSNKREKKRKQAIQRRQREILLSALHPLTDYADDGNNGGTNNNNNNNTMISRGGCDGEKGRPSDHHPPHAHQKYSMGIRASSALATTGERDGKKVDYTAAACSSSSLAGIDEEEEEGSSSNGMMMGRRRRKRRVDTKAFPSPQEYRPERAVRASGLHRLPPSATIGRSERFR